MKRRLEYLIIKKYTKNKNSDKDTQNRKMKNPKVQKSERCENVKSKNRIIQFLDSLCTNISFSPPSRIDICVHNESKNYKMFNRLICIKMMTMNYFGFSNAAFIFFIFTSFE